MSYYTLEANSVDEARSLASEQGVPCLVLSEEILQQIESAEAEGGFVGGLSGASGDGGYSAEGVAGPNSSTALEPAPVELLDMDGAVPAGALFEEAVEKILDLKDIWEAFHGDPLGPVILVPKRELDRWLGRGGPTA